MLVYPCILTYQMCIGRQSNITESAAGVFHKNVTREIYEFTETRQDAAGSPIVHNDDEGIITHTC